MTLSPLRAAAMALLLAAIPAAAADAPKPPAAKGLPPNTIDCTDWTHNSDGSWSAHHNAKPFDIGSSKHITIQDSRIGPNAISAGGYDLATVLDEKCGTV
ncbi:MAG TPA: hypothetical protein VHY79_08260 [Rhizomicrobium sp.]|nr:hypothetical protein [Rhizomicrobium sp.]